MNDAYLWQSVPLWIEVLIALMMVLGSFFVIMASFGMMRLKSFYMRLHMVSLITVGAAFCLTIAYLLITGFVKGRFASEALLLFVFIFMAGPISLMMIARGALYREMFFFMRRQPRKKILETFRNFRKERRKLDRKRQK